MKKRAKYNWIGLVSVVLLILLDQWSKWMAVLHLKEQEPFVIWDGVFELHYLENRGAAFGIMQGQKTLFVLCTVLVLACIVLFYQRLPETKKFHPLRVIGVMLVAGAIGNLIDRLAYSYVIDFFYFKLIDFPIFNVADCYVTVATILLMVLILFCYKDEDLEFVSFRKKDGK